MRTRVSRSLVQLREWAGVLALGLVLTGGVAYAAETIGSGDVINESLLSEDIKNNEVKTVDIGNNQVLTADVRNGTLNDEDIAQGTFVNFAAVIGGADQVIPESECEFASITGIDAQGDHMLLTPARQGTYDRIDFSIRYSGGSAALLQSCNNGSGAQSTAEPMHFNLLVFDAQ